MKMKKKYKNFLALFLLITLSGCSSKDEEFKLMENDEIVNFTKDQDLPSVRNGSTDDESFLTGGNKKTWIWDTGVQGHFGCGPVTSYSPDWWPAAPNEMESFEIYDDELVFCSNDNSYILNAHGYIYVDPSAKEVMGANERDIAPYTQPEGQKWTLVYEDDKKYIQFSDKAFPSFVGGPEALGDKYEIIELTEEILHLRWVDVDNCQAWYYRFKVKDNEPNIGEATVWNFDYPPEDWSHNNVSDSPDLIVYKDGMLRISTQAGTEQRKKTFTNSWEYAQGKYQWRIFVSDLGIGEKCSIGAFLYHDDEHELDFEIASGKESLRNSLGAGEDELLVYMTSQGNPWFQKIVKIKKNKWHTFEIDLKLINGSYKAIWSIDGKIKAEKQLDFGNKTTFRVFCSLENLNFCGDFLPLKDNYTLFDYVKYTEYK